MTIAILASGQSLNADDVSYIKDAKDSGKLNGVLAVSNVGLDLAPWADALVSHDSSWWFHNPRTYEFKGRKFCRNHWARCEVYIPDPKNGCNSGYMAMQIARDIYKADRIILLGFDMHGTHYFGPHPTGLKNTTPERFQKHLNQFNGWVGPAVINCTPNSALTKFPYQPLRDVI